MTEGAAPASPLQAHLQNRHGPDRLSLDGAQHIGVVNDNNFPSSSVRTMGQPDNNGLTLTNTQSLIDAK